MHKEYILVVDAGTSGLRSIIFEIEGNIIGAAYEEYSILTPKSGWAEQRPEDWWEALVNTVPDAIDQANIEPQEIQGITITNQQVSTTVIDKNFKVLYPAILWMDTRTSPQVDQLKEELGDKLVIDTVGMSISTTWNIPRILWIKQNRPNIFNQAHKFLFLDSYLYGKLTGRFVSDHSNTCFSAFDISSREWSKEILDAVGIDESSLPTPIQPGDKVGTLTKSSAKEIGLPQDIEVIAGASDQPASAIGLGAVKPGRFEATTGTGTFMVAHLEEVRTDPQSRVMTNCSGIPNKWHFYGVHYLSGALLRWYRDEFGKLEKKLGEELGLDPFSIIAQEAANTTAGAEGLVLLPFFQGARTPYWDSNAKGVLYGLTLDHGRQEIARAILESNGFGIRHSVSVFEDLGIEIKEIRVAGGGAKSSLWRQIQADITGKPVLLPEVNEASALGAAILGWYGLGKFNSIEEGCDELVKIKATHRPDHNSAQVYNELFELYKELYQSLKSSFQRPEDV